MMHRRFSVLLLAVVCCQALCGCNGGRRAEPLAPGPRELPHNVASLVLTPGTLPAVYGVQAFVYATGHPDRGGAVVDDLSAADAGLALDDARLLVIVEGSGDTLKGFRHTARLIAGSRYAWQGQGRGLPLLVVPVHWSDSTDPVAEHLNLRAQTRGAVALRDMLRAHGLRHEATPRSAVAILGFSAGTRVVQMAFGCRIREGDTTATDGGERPEGADRVSNIAFVGGSVGRADPLPFEGIRGRFVNFVNPRDTHFGDRAPYAAPAGAGPALGHVISGRFLQRAPGFGASANGFDRLATLTAPDQFEAADSSPRAREAFRMVNFRVPAELVPYSVVGGAIENDDLDDFINQAPNHYILVGRGPGGATGGPVFSQYSEVAADFVQSFVAPALLLGRVPASALAASPRPINPLKVITEPLKIPGKLVEPLLPGPKGAEQEKDEKK